MRIVAGLYRRHESRLIRGRDSGTLSEEEDDRIADVMESLWWELSDDERAEVDARVAEYLAGRAAVPQKLDLVDLPLVEGDSRYPRRPSEAA